MGALSEVEPPGLTCHRCGAHVPIDPPGFPERVAHVRAWYREQSIWVGVDLEVDEESAALLFKRKAGTLKNWRNVPGSGPRIPFKTRGREVFYEIPDLVRAKAEYDRRKW